MDNIVWQEKLDSAYRQEKTKTKGLVVWFTGLSGSGKSTIASIIEAKLIESGKISYLLDGDNIRHGLCSDLGFSQTDRMENIRRISEVAALFEDCGVITLVSAITPLESMRQLIASKVKKLVMVYVNADIQTCIQRDPKGLYEKALKGQIKDYTGIDSPFEIPQDYDIELDTKQMSIDQCVSRLMEYLKGVIDDGPSR